MMAHRCASPRKTPRIWTSTTNRSILVIAVPRLISTTTIVMMTMTMMVAAPLRTLTMMMTTTTTTMTPTPTRNHLHHPVRSIHTQTTTTITSQHHQHFLCLALPSKNADDGPLLPIDDEPGRRTAVSTVVAVANIVVLIVSYRN